MQVETGRDLKYVESSGSAVETDLQTARVPVPVQERRALDVTVTPIVYTQTTEPTQAREGDFWNNNGAYKKLKNGAWVDVAESEIATRSSTTVGRNPDPVESYTTAIGTLAEAIGRFGVAGGGGAKASGYASNAYGHSARALAELSNALGPASYVDPTSPRSQAIGSYAQVPANTPDHTVVAANELRVKRSSGSGASSLILSSPDGSSGIITPTDDDRILVNGVEVGREDGRVSIGRTISLRNHFSVGSLGSIAISANRMYFVPVFVARDLTATSLLINITASATGTLAASIYDNDPVLFVARNLLKRTNPDPAIGPVGLQTITMFSDTPVRRAWHWLGLIASVAISIQGANVNGQIPSLRGGVDTNLNTLLMCFTDLPAGPPWTFPNPVSPSSGPANTYLDIAARTS